MNVQTFPAASEVVPQRTNYEEATEETVEEVKESLGSISEDDVSSKWAQVVSRIMEINGPLAHLLKSSQFISAHGGIIKVEVKYKFHKQNLEHPKNQQVIRQVFKEVYGQNLALVGEVRPLQDTASQAASLPVLNEALKVFGGELME